MKGASIVLPVRLMRRILRDQHLIPIGGVIHGGHRLLLNQRGRKELYRYGQFLSPDPESLLLWFRCLFGEAQGQPESRAEYRAVATAVRIVIMASYSLIRLGHPKLRLKSKKVRIKELQTERFQIFLDALTRICLANNGAGIAAPQVGINKRVIVVHVDPNNPRYPGKKPFPLTIVINPRVVAHSKEKKEDWEGDLSATIRGLVPRSVSCTVTGLDRNGREVRFDLEYDFHARVFQHEIDHLDGILFVDRMRSMKSLTEFAEWKKYWRNKGQEIRIKK